MSIKGYLVDLTSRRAVHLFLAFLVCGSGLIVGDVALPWSPALCVSAYGAILLYSATVFLVPHSEMTNNSPYFLGFLFFLISLVRTFWGIPLNSADAQMGKIISQLGGALLATVVGLPFRQLLFAYSPAQAEQDLFFRTLEEELRRSATEFRRSQTELVQLLQEFVESRRGLFTDEEKASKRYIRSLEKAIAVFDTSLSHYPTLISSALSECTRSLQMLKEKSSELSQAAQSMSPEQIVQIVVQFTTVKDRTAGLAAEVGRLQSALSEITDLAAHIPISINAQLHGAQSEFDEVRAQLRKKLDQIQADVSAIDKVLSDFASLMQQRVGAAV